MLTKPRPRFNESTLFLSWSPPMSRFALTQTGAKGCSQITGEQTYSHARQERGEAVERRRGEREGHRQGKEVHEIVPRERYEKKRAPKRTRHRLEKFDRSISLSLLLRLLTLPSSLFSPLRRPLCRPGRFPPLARAHVAFTAQRKIVVNRMYVLLLSKVMHNDKHAHSFSLSLSAW